MALLVLTIATPAASDAVDDTGARWWHGEVVAATARWTTDGASIVTDVRLRTAGGADVVVSQVGGHVDGITMVVLHGPPALVPGQRVNSKPAAPPSTAR